MATLVVERFPREQAAAPDNEAAAAVVGGGAVVGWWLVMDWWSIGYAFATIMSGICCTFSPPHSAVRPNPGAPLFLLPTPSARSGSPLITRVMNSVHVGGGEDCSKHLGPVAV